LLETILTAVRKSFWLSVICALGTLALAQSQNRKNILANQNRIPAGQLVNGTLTLHLELRDGVWHPEAEDGPVLYVQAFAESDRPAQIPGPLLRMPEGTTVHVTVTNSLGMKATVYGLNTRPGDVKAGLVLDAGQSRELSFAAGAPGTYFYWARTSTENLDKQPRLADAQLNGAFIVDPAGTVPPDRIFVMDQMMPRADVLHPDFEVVTINGKSYPYTEPLQYTVGETVRWRVINASVAEHPMHLHGSFYEVLSLGNFESNTDYPPGERQLVVTQNLRTAQTMMMEWKPEHIGRWLFHCHFQKHISNTERVPQLLPTVESTTTATHDHDHDKMGAMNDMAGLVLAVTINPKAGAAEAHPAPASVHKLDLIIEPRAAGEKSPAFACSVREGKKVVVSEGQSMGPPIVVMRGEPTEITIQNHLDEPTIIHWHGLELESYYDGVIGGGAGSQTTPAIAAGASFAARFTANRAGTFIYHTHAPSPKQLTDGVYGPLIVLEPGERFDPEHDKLIVIGTREADFYAERITINGSEAPAPIVIDHGVKYRLRLINIAPELRGDFQLGTKDHPVTWLALAKDGAVLPPRLATSGDATLHIVSGETYDFEFKSETPGEIPLQVGNQLNTAKITTTVVVK
jgi:FtsP/CotA-like multicopper oxidase with cupredoxin domain